VLQEHVAKQGQLPWPFSEFHELADVQRIGANASVGLRLETHWNSKNCDIVAAIRSVLNEFCMDASAIQRSFKGELESVFAQCLPAECMVYAESIA